eukprot:gene9956-13389_t
MAVWSLTIIYCILISNLHLYINCFKYSPGSSSIISPASFSQLNLSHGQYGLKFEKRINYNSLEQLKPTIRPHTSIRTANKIICLFGNNIDGDFSTSPMKVIIAGAPAAGKGTQCEVITKEFNLVHLSTGDILRAAVKEGTELGKKAKEYMDSGKLVPDELITGVICDRLKQEDCQTRGWLLDGFPRTESQAAALTNAGMIPDCFLLLDVKEDVLVERVTGRRTDPVTGKIYHLKFNPPENDEIASRLIQRSDDTAEKIIVRFKEFQSHIDNVKSSYADKMVCIDGCTPQAEVTNNVLSNLKAVKSKNTINKLESADISQAMKVIIAGAPAAGKGTQCEVITKEFNLVHLSTGDILRAAVKEGTELGKKAKEYMDSGKLVPDELITGVICDRLKQEDCQTRGWLLDGFPRTESQAAALTNAGMIPDCFLLLDVKEDVLVERVTGRRTDPVTGKIYHLKFNPPENDEIASRLIQRSDDTAEKIIVRFKEFQSHIDNVKSSYADKMVCIDGCKSQSEVKSEVLKVLSTVKTNKNKVDDKSNDKNNNNGDNSSSVVVSKTNSNRWNPSSLIKPNNPIQSTMLGIMLLISADKVLAKLFKDASIAFPSSLAGMVGLFGIMSTISSILPEFTDKLFYLLSFSVSFIKCWLALFFVPPLVILPLKLHLVKGFEAKLLMLVVSGLIGSLTASGLFSKWFNKLFPISDSSSNSKIVAAAGVPNLPPLKYPAIASLLWWIISIVSPHQSIRSIAQRGFGITATISSFIVGNRAPPSLKKVIHPLILCAASTTSLLYFFGLTYGEKFVTSLSKYYGNGFGSGDIISSLLGPSIICFGLQLFQYRDMLRKSASVMIATTAFSSIFGLYSSAFLAKLAGLYQREVALSTLTRCITSPLALSGAAITGADPSLAAFLVVLTGIFGASFGESYLKSIGVDDPLSVGLAVGSSAHGLGTSALAYDAQKFASAVVSMTLTGLWTVALISNNTIRKQLIKIAI